MVSKKATKAKSKATDKEDAPTLTKKLKRALIEDIEEIGLPLKDISLVQLCDKKSHIYGGPSTETRRAIQKFFQKLKKRPIKSYHKLLVDFEVTPGPNTFHRLRTENATNKTTPGNDGGEEEAAEEEDQTTVDVSSVVEPSIADPTEQTVAESKEEVVPEEFVLAVKPTVESTCDSSVNNTSTENGEAEEAPRTSGQEISEILQKFNSFCFDPQQTNANLEMMSPNKPPPPALMFGSITSPVPTPSLTDTDDSTEVMEKDDVAESILNFRFQFGTKRHPFIIMVNTYYPERNGPLFDIVKFEDVEYNDYEHGGYHIRVSCDLPDYEAYEATIPSPDEFPVWLPLFGRIVLFRTPSRSFWIRDHTRYHGDKKKIDCIVTKKVHEKTGTAIDEEPERQYSYHLAVFKPGTKLDNSIFSNNNMNVKRNHNGMRMEANNKDNAFEKKIYGMAVWWRIAEAGGTRIRQADHKINAKTLLD